MITQSLTRRYVIGGVQFQAPPLEAALYLVATPIGNLGDITLRALEVLAAVDIVACEDTRVTRTLLERYAIGKKPRPYHEHNAKSAGAALLAALREGKSIALVSDAGTPLISDPGFHLVREAREAGIRIVPLPGASAALAALVVSGLPTDSFFFDGFLPAKAGQRRKRLEELQTLAATLIFYESPHRAAQTLTDMAEILGAERAVVLCRELTKLFEETDSSTLAALAQKYAGEARPRGEIVLIIGPPLKTEKVLSEEEIDALLREATQTMSASRAAAQVALVTGERKQDLYQRLLHLKAHP